MANFRKRGEPGRFTKGPNALTEQLYARVTLTQLAAFARLGGAAWLRQQIDAAVAADRDLPTANQPFPPVFTVTDAKTGRPVPHSVTVREF